MTPEELLAEAERLRVEKEPADADCWPRACAWLTRVALETGLDRYWGRVEPSVVACPMRAQLLLLPSYAGPAIAYRARHAWGGLSRAAHHHAYEHVPTAAELRGWHESVSNVLADLATNVSTSPRRMTRFCRTSRQVGRRDAR